jgi:hypothetical protein
MVDACELQRMAAVMEHCDVGGARGSRETNRRILHRGLVHVETEYGLKPDAPEGCGNVFRVIAGIDQARGVFISAVADDKGHPAFGDPRPS